MTARPSAPDLTVNNPAGVSYVQGSAADDESWRLTVVAHPGLLAVEHKEILTEVDITLDDAKKTAIEGGPYTDADPYYASVLTDTRGLPLAVDGLNGDMTGRVIDWNGFTWRNHDDAWIEKVRFEESLFSDRGVFQRMNIIDSDPNDLTRYPPTPLVGTTLGARNTDPAGAGAEMISITSKDGVEGMLIAVVHSSTGIPVTADQAVGLRADGFPIVFNYAPAFLSNVPLNYVKGQVTTHQGIRYVCNLTGVQNGLFDDFSDRWDPEIVLANFNRLATSYEYEVAVDFERNVVYAGFAQ